MKILITGAGGMLSHALIDVLKNEQLFTFDKAMLDITDKQAVFAAVNQIKPDFVINAAAYTAVDDAEDHAEETFKINTHAVTNLIEACNVVGSFLVQFSTDYVFDGEQDGGYKEDAPKNPLNTYGKSKADAEDLIVGNSNNYAIIRTSWLYGPHGKNFVDTMLRLGKERDRLTVVNDQIGSPTYTYDLAAAVYSFLKNPQNGIFHLTNDTVLTWYDFAKLIFEIEDITVQVDPISTEEFAAKAYRSKNSQMLNTKLPKLPPVEDALRRYLN